MKDFAWAFGKQGRRFCLAFPILFICFAISACKFGPDNYVSLSYDEAVKKVTFDGDVETVDFSNLNNHDIYLIKINTSGLVVPAEDTGGVMQAIPEIPSEESIRIPYFPENGYHRFRTAIDEFNANPPPIERDVRHRASMTTANYISYNVDDEKNFWVERTYDSDNWVNKSATLLASGDHVNVWVINENTYSSGTSRNIISIKQAEGLARHFDLIYPVATNLLGYEYGGGPDGDGGMDGDKKIQILIYDIVDGHGGVSAGGYFWSKDFYTQKELDSYGLEYKTNLAEIFYIDASTVIYSPDYTYIALIHEFQHMINFNKKYVSHNLNSSTWYNEMLSVLAEDVIAPLIGINHTNPGHPISVRIPRFLNSHYKYSITEWKSDNDSYAVLYAFGAYLLRNYGGPELLKMILDNDKIDIDSITMALHEFSKDLDFEKALNRYGEAMIFSGSAMPESGARGIDVFTFDRTVTSTVNGQEYTAYGFNIWHTYRYGTDETGPAVLSESSTSMKPHSVIIHSTDEWKNITGDFSITLEKPFNQDVIFYLMAR